MLRNRLVRNVRLAFEIVETSGGRGVANLFDAQKCAPASVKSRIGEVRQLHRLAPREGACQDDRVIPSVIN